MDRGARRSGGAETGRPQQQQQQQISVFEETFQNIAFARCTEEWKQIRNLQEARSAKQTEVAELQRALVDIVKRVHTASHELATIDEKIAAVEDTIRSKDSQTQGQLRAMLQEWEGAKLSDNVALVHRTEAKYREEVSQLKQALSETQQAHRGAMRELQEMKATNEQQMLMAQRQQHQALDERSLLIADRAESHSKQHREQRAASRSPQHHRSAHDGTDSSAVSSVAAASAQSGRGSRVVEERGSAQTHQQYTQHRREQVVESLEIHQGSSGVQPPRPMPSREMREAVAAASIYRPEMSAAHNTSTASSSSPPQDAYLRHHNASTASAGGSSTRGRSPQAIDSTLTHHDAVGSARRSASTGSDTAAATAAADASLGFEVGSRRENHNAPGVYITAVQEGNSPAWKAGLRPNDVILQWGDVKIKSLEDLRSAVHKGSDMVVIRCAASTGAGSSGDGGDQSSSASTASLKGLGPLRCVVMKVPPSVRGAINRRKERYAESGHF